MTQTETQVRPTAAAGVATKQGRMITIKEVEQHNTVADAWTVIDNQVYDITEWAQKHPGGDLIRLAAGRDSTCLVESYHPRSSMGKVSAALKTQAKLLGTLVDGIPIPDKTFFHTVQERATAYLTDNKYPMHYYEVVGLTETVVTLALYLLSNYYKVFYDSTVGAMLTGFFLGRLGFLMHMGNHAAMSSNMWINKFHGYMHNVIGSMHWVWRYEHQVAHHMDPNHLGKDNDCEIGDPVLRFHPGLPRTWMHRYQHITTPLLMTGGLVKWYFMDFFNFFTGQVGHVRMYITSFDWLILAIFKSVWFYANVILAWQYSSGPASFALNFLLHVGIGGHYMENIFIVNHIQDELVPPNTLHWSNRQVMATANWASGSTFWNFFSGGLNHQIEHHLFPSTSHYLYPHLAPIVEKTCREFNLPYVNYPSFPAAWMAMIRYLRDLGTEKFDKKA